MRNVTENYSPTNNFWKENPQFAAVDPFAKLHRTDKSSNKVNSSAIMWGVALMYDPKSDFYYLDGKEDKVAKAIKRDCRIDVDWSRHQDVIDAFKETRLDQAHKSLIAWEIRMKERDEFLKEQKWSFDSYSEDGRLVKGTADQLDKMHSQTAKHFKEYEVVVKDLQELEAKNNSGKKSKNVEVDA